MSAGPEIAPVTAKTAVTGAKTGRNGPSALPKTLRRGTDPDVDPLISSYLNELKNPMLMAPAY